VVLVRSRGVSEAARDASSAAPLVVGRYALFDELAAGGMATVHLGRLLGPVGFGRTVAIKRLHAHFLNDPDFLAMFMDEARIVARIRHPNVVPMVDVVQSEHGLFLVMEYVHGESLARLVRVAREAKEPVPPRIVAAVMHGVLMGLHAAHETKGADGRLLDVVHRDVSPQNIIVGADGVARVLDFGVAKAAGRSQVTRDGQIKGKIAYMAPEQIRGQVDRRTDVFAASVVLWEALVGRRLHEGAKDVDIVSRAVQGKFARPSDFVPELSPALDALVLRGLASNPAQRFATARELAIELERTVGLATTSDVSEWVERLAADALRARGALVDRLELASAGLTPATTQPPPAPFADTRGVAPNALAFDVGLAATPDVPSSSAVFAHTQTPAHGAEVVRPAASLRPWVVAVSISAVLAIVGVSLGAYAVTHRKTASRASASSAFAATSAAPLAATASTTSDLRAPGVIPSAAATLGDGASTGPMGAGKPAARPAASGAPPTIATPPATVPLPSNAKKSDPSVRAKPSCDPAYTVDEAGHRHYKPECLD